MLFFRGDSEGSVLLYFTMSGLLSLPSRLLCHPLAALLQAGGNHPECLCPILAVIKHGQKFLRISAVASREKVIWSLGEPFL